MQRYEFQDATTHIIGYSDSDWGTDRATRRSVSGGAVLLGSHVVAFWSRLQDKVALSSAEAECFAANKCLIEMMGIMHMAVEHLGHGSCALELRLDASATRGSLLRNGWE